MMKIVTLRLHWDVGEATTALELIDNLRDQIAQEYGDAIAQNMRQALRESTTENQQLAFPFADLDPF